MKTQSWGTWLARCTAVWIVCTAATDAWSQARFRFDQTPGRLSRQVIPEQVDLDFKLDPTLPRFEGRAQVQLQLLRPQASIVLHASSLQADGAAQLEDELGRRWAMSLSTDADAMTWTLKPQPPKQRLPAGRYRLSLAWTGAVSASGEGLFRAGGKALPMLATQLQAIHARNVFPAFDEPAFRARYRISVQAPKGLQVLSNMPLAREESADEKHTLHRFDNSPPMPSYLVAVAVGDFDVLRASSDKLPLAIYTEKGKTPLAAHAMAVTQQVMPYFENYFGQAYALPKLDQLAVPSVRMGAMEDWGLVSYIEGAFLHDPQRQSQDHQRKVYDLIAHELSHQWFGNLVTAASWNEIWLNEAFATWMALKVTHHFNPQWQIPLAHRLVLEGVLARDAGRATRPIRGDEVTEARVFDVFDDITYEKGGAVLTMLEQWVGEARFRDGLRSYMAERRMSSATAGDLWHHLGRAAGRDVRGVARGWTDRTGYPLLHTEEACVAGRTQLRLRQEPFRSLAEDKPAPTANRAQARLWPIPVTLSRGSEKRVVLMRQREMRLADLGACSTTPWLANAGGGGFYRVSPDARTTRVLSETLVKLEPVDQVSVFSDQLALMQIGQLSVDTWLDNLTRLAEADDTSRASLYAIAIRGLTWLHQAAGEHRPLVENKARAVLAAEFKRLGWEERSGESGEVSRLRSQLIQTLARMGDEPVIHEAGRRFDTERAGGTRIPGNIRQATLLAAARAADAVRFEALLEALRKAGTQSERRQMAAALGSVADRALAQRAMQLALSDEIQPDLVDALLGSMRRTTLHDEPLYAFVKQNHQALSARMGSGPFGPGVWLLPSAAAGLSTSDAAKRLLDDQRSLGGPDSLSPAQTVAQDIVWRARWVERYLGDLRKALAPK